MTQLPDHLTSERWLAQFLSSAEARKGGIVKRQIRDVERLVGRAAFIAAVERRGFQAVENGRHFIVAVENGRHFIVFCNNDPIRRVHSAPRESAFERAS